MTNSPGPTSAGRHVLTDLARTPDAVAADILARLDAGTLLYRGRGYQSEAGRQSQVSSPDRSSGTDTGST